jgi:hypothetical protein
MILPSFCYRRLDPEKLQIATIIVSVAWLILMVTELYFLRSHGYLPQAHLQDRLPKGKVFFVLFVSIWLLLLLWPAFVGMGLCYVLYRNDVLGRRWWVVAAGSFPISLLSYWPAWRFETRVNPGSSFLLAVALSIAFQIVYIAIVAKSLIFIRSRNKP